MLERAGISTSKDTDDSCVFTAVTLAAGIWSVISLQHTETGQAESVLNGCTAVSTFGLQAHSRRTREAGLCGVEYKWAILVVKYWRKVAEFSEEEEREKQVMFVLQCISPDFWPLFCMRLVGPSFRRYELRKTYPNFTSEVHEAQKPWASVITLLYFYFLVI